MWEGRRSAKIDSQGKPRNTHGDEAFSLFRQANPFIKPVSMGMVVAEEGLEPPTRGL